MATTELKLSRLAYEVVIDSIVLPYNSEFYGDGGYEAFLNHKDYFANNSDFSMQFRKVMPAINLAISRLQEYDKLPYFMKTLDVFEDSESHSQYALIPDGFDYLKIVNVFRRTPNGGWVNYGFTIQEEKIYLQGREIPLAKAEDGETKGRVEIEYKKNIPLFQEHDIIVDSVDSGRSGIEHNDTNVDLRKEYGFTRMDYEFVKLFAEAQIVEELDPTTGFNKLQIAENYFADLDTHKPNFSQKTMNRRF